MSKPSPRDATGERLLQLLTRLDEHASRCRKVQSENEDKGLNNTADIFRVMANCHEADADLLRDVLSARSETLCIPEGWKLVPMKATSAMVKAAIDYHYDVEQSEGMAGVYRIMINAAPQDDCHTSGRAQGQRSGKSLDQREAGLPVGAAPVSVPSATPCSRDEIIEACAKICDEMAVNGRDSDTQAGRHAAGALDMAAYGIRATKGGEWP